jgi:hypothetical protein
VRHNCRSALTQSGLAGEIGRSGYDGNCLANAERALIW